MEMKELMKAFGYIGAATMVTILAGCASTPPGGAPIEDHSSYAPDVGKASPATGGSGAVLKPLVPGVVRDSGRTHVVAPGDTLYNISVRYGLEPRALASLNAVSDPTQLRVGQVLRLPESIAEPRDPVVSSNVRVTRVPTDSASATMPKRTSEEPTTVVLDPSKQTSSTPAISNTPNQDIESPKQPSDGKIPAVVPGTRMLWPVQGEVASDFAKNGKGIDISGTQGDVVVAAATGQVLFVGELKGYGNLVIVKHSATLVTAYGHVERITVKVNDKVRSGQKIAEMGSVGGRALLRFEVREKGQPVDPMRYLGPKR